ncbi:hypothetical protein [Yinghuangia sp. YIM S09857]|uniref:hypothetical protein n=1 Tax=Yinghuangia sp. YIM S09857 TaxID=3436929 RepID=UPI003F52AF8C
MTVDELLQRRPWRWGSRGDPHAWDAMRERAHGRPLPDNAFDLRRSPSGRISTASPPQRRDDIRHVTRVELDRVSGYNCQYLDLGPAGRAG